MMESNSRSNRSILINVTSLTISQCDSQDPVEIPLEQVCRNGYESEIDIEIGQCSFENEQSQAHRRINAFKSILPYLRIKNNKIDVGSTARRGKKCCSTCCTWTTWALQKVTYEYNFF